MPAVLVCSSDDLGATLERTVLGRQEFERLFVRTLEEARSTAVAALPAIVLVDRDLPWAADLVELIRQDAATRNCALTVVARGDFQDVDRELLRAGANAVLRLPPDEEWDKRLAHLLRLAVRRQVRVPLSVQLDASLGAAEDSLSATTVNVSETGIAIESPAPLSPGRELDFSFVIPNTSITISGRARVERVAGDNQYGLEFTYLAGDAFDQLRAFLQTP